ncbi:MAG: DUF4336 domain-containing protein [Pleurocapsa sp.]
MSQKLDSRYYHWRYWFLVPIYPYSKRRTICQEIVKDTIWTFDQLQGIFYVVVPIRMTVVKLSTGGLLVYAPVAPTAECLDLVNELVAKHGDIKYIILPTASGLEHKVFVVPFARRFPQAQVFVAPQQWSFPLNIPLSWLGFPSKRTHVLPPNSKDTPFGDEFDYAILPNIDLGLGQFQEVAFSHKRSRTLLVTDTIISIPHEPPAIVQLDPYPLLFHARDSALEPIEDTYPNRRRGWQRICLFAMYFRSSVLEVPKWSQVFANALKSPEKSKKAYFGLFPFDWQVNWYNTFTNLRGNGRLLVAPILRTLILNRAPEETLEWANQVARWDFERIIPCHFDNAIAATPQEFRQAFSFLEQHPAIEVGLYPQSLPEEDLQLLQDIDRRLYQSRLVPPPKR